MNRSQSAASEELGLRSGEMVEVRSAEDILATLDDRGCLEGLPFMHEMLPFCGRRFRVYRRADKTCDTVREYGGLRMLRTVHLENLRCDGGGHGGCEASCLLFWKEAWLRRVPAGTTDAELVQIESPSRAEQPGERQLAELLGRAACATEDGSETFMCQATELPRASERLSWWDMRQYVRDLRTGNVTLSRLLRGTSFALYAMLRRRLGSPRYPALGGSLTRTPSERLDLRPGELVQVRSRKEIFATLDQNCRNRGLWYDVEMWRFSGGTYRVLRRVDHIINEKTGRMIRLPGPCVILEGAFCSGDRSRKRMFCPRSIYPYWREIWLRRVT